MSITDKDIKKINDIEFFCSHLNIQVNEIVNLAKLKLNFDKVKRKLNKEIEELEDQGMLDEADAKCMLIEKLDKMYINLKKSVSNMTDEQREDIAKTNYLSPSANAHNPNTNPNLDTDTNKGKTQPKRRKQQTDIKQNISDKQKQNIEMMENLFTTYKGANSPDEFIHIDVANIKHKKIVLLDNQEINSKLSLPSDKLPSSIHAIEIKTNQGETYYIASSEKEELQNIFTCPIVSFLYDNKKVYCSLG